MVRIIRRSLTQGKFEMPHYVILRKTFEEGETYVLHRHTIPSFIPLENLAEEYLGRRVAGLENFALAIHRHLILLSNRTEIAAKLKEFEGVEEIKSDEAVRLVEVITSQWTARIILLDEGERLIILNNDGERLKEMEERILKGKEDNDLVTRIARAM
jgi:hypothetical protein